MITNRLRPSVRTAATLTALSACAAAVAPSPSAAAERANDAEGIWRTSGYGLVLVVEGARMQVYDLTASTCVRSLSFRGSGPHATRRWVSTNGTALTAFATGNADTLRARVDGSVGTMLLRRVEELPASCGTTGTDRRAAAAAASEAFAELYPAFPRRRVGLTAVATKLRAAGEAPSDEAAFEQMVDALEPLGDAHVGLADFGSERLWSGSRSGTRPLTPVDWAKAKRSMTRSLGVAPRDWHDGRIAYARTEDGVGYLRVAAFAGFADGTAAADRRALRRTLDRILGGPSAPTSGLVVDVRRNEGGYDQLALDLAGRFTQRGYLAYRKAARADRRDPAGFAPAQDIRVARRTGPGFDGQVVLLTGSDTVSAGETFTMAMAARPGGVTRIGRATQGALSDVVTRTLPNGWFLLLSHEHYTTPDGRSFEGTGVPPTHKVPVWTGAELRAGKDSALSGALRRLG